MLTPRVLATLAASCREKESAAKTRRGRSGRNCKGPAMAKQLDAAGSARQTVRGVMPFPRGSDA